MDIIFISGKIPINLVILTSLLINYLLVSRVNAKTQKNIDLIEHNNNYEEQSEVISVDYLRWRNKNYTPTLANEPAKVFPNPNEINVPTPINPLQTPDTNSEQDDTSIQQNITPAISKKDLELFILNALSNSATKYPWIIDPRDNFSFYSSTFNPLKDTRYIDLSTKFSSEEPVINRFTFAEFPKKESTLLDITR